MVGPGTFTLDYAAARQKLNEYRLESVYWFVLKFVQAANLAADSFEVVLQGQPSVSFKGWDPELSLEKITNHVATASLNLDNDPLSFLSIGINTLLITGLDSVEVCHQKKGSTTQECLVLGKSMETASREVERAVDVSTLTISWSANNKLESGWITKVLTERCSFSAVPISVNNAPLAFRPLGSSTEYRSDLLIKKHTLYQEAHVAPDTLVPTQVSVFQETEQVKSSPYTAYFEVNTDLDREATIWFSRAGVLIEKEQQRLSIDGLIVVVSADALSTDLTGSRLVRDRDFVELIDWLKVTSKTLLEPALAALPDLKADLGPPIDRKVTFLQEPLKRGLCYTVISLLLVWNLGLYFNLDDSTRRGWFLLVTAVSLGATAFKAFPRITTASEATNRELQDSIRKQLTRR